MAGRKIPTFGLYSCPFSDNSINAMRKIIFIFLLTLILSIPAMADSERRDLDIFGWVEWAELMEGKIRMKAKLDTGAANSSLDATNIERYREDGKRWVRFTVTDPESEEKLIIERRLVRNVRIVRHGDEYQRRPVVKMDVCLGDRLQEVEVNLIDRSNFIYPLLLGRSALEQVALVDSGDSFLFGPTCHSTDNEE